MAYESYGRLDRDSAAALQALATAVALAGRAAGRTSGCGLYDRWRCDLERLLMKEQAGVALLFLGAGAASMASGCARCASCAAAER